MADDECAEDLSSYHERRLNEFRETVAHREISIAASMHYCAEVGISPPKWLTEAAAELVCQLLKSQRTTAIGRSRGKIPHFRQYMAHVERWFAVHAVREIAARVRRDRAILMEDGNRYPADFRDSYEKELERRSKWLSHGVFACASMYLLGTPSFAGPDAVKSSYQMVQEMNDSPAENQCCIFEQSFLEKLGLGYEASTQGKKLLHLFDLTP